MSRELKYNVDCKDSDELLLTLYKICDEIKIGLHLKNFKVYENFLNRLYKNIVTYQYKIFDKENQDFNENDSDNEYNEYNNEDNKDNEDDEYNEDYISEYNTDTDDEDYNKTINLLEIHDIICEKKIKEMRDDLLIEYIY